MHQAEQTNPVTREVNNFKGVQNYVGHDGRQVRVTDENTLL